MRWWIGATLSLFVYASFGVHVTARRDTTLSRISGTLLLITFLELVVYCAVVADDG
jgi:hypothetical protein